jgi:transcription antitermination protein NusB
MAKISRRKAREEAVILLYQSDLLEKDIEKIITNEISLGRVIDTFTADIVRGVKNNLEEIDGLIKRIVENWTLERIAFIDRNIIRVGIYEMLYKNEIPLKVSVDEAIEIAKGFGQKEDTPKFVNGVLGKIFLEIQQGKTLKNIG